MQPLAPAQILIIEILLSVSTLHRRCAWILFASIHEWLLRQLTMATG
jgi:hypothetical protein